MAAALPAGWGSVMSRSGLAREGARTAAAGQMLNTSGEALASNLSAPSSSKFSTAALAHNRS
eukprot:6810987-Lingulodinium_polyedra.AAC.1